MKKAEYGFASWSIKDSDQPTNIHSHTLPIYASSAFEFADLEEGISIFSGEKPGYVYGRYGNPTLDAVAQKIARLEGLGTGEEPKGYLTPSGLSAIHLAVLTAVPAGKKLLAQYNLYGGTSELFKKVVELEGRGVIFADPGDQEQLNDILRQDPDIAAIYLETPSNPDLKCVDIARVCAVASDYGVLTILDNTFATPYLQKGFALGVDVVVMSTTKYLNGNGNLIGGIIIGKDQEFMSGKVKEHLKLMGAMASPFDAWLLNNGLKTLALRMDKHCDNAEVLADRLESHAQVARVHYPGLLSHPDHAVAKRQMSRFGGMLSFELKGGLEAGKQLMRNIRFCSFAPTLGNVDTLILHPASSSHLRVAREIREQSGITDALIRVSVGIESIEDILGDIIGALDSLK